MLAQVWTCGARRPPWTRSPPVGMALHLGQTVSGAARNGQGRAVASRGVATRAEPGGQMRAMRQVRAVLACVALAVPVAVVAPGAPAGAAIAVADGLVAVQRRARAPARRGARRPPAGRDAPRDARRARPPGTPPRCRGSSRRPRPRRRPRSATSSRAGSSPSRFGPTSEAIATVRDLLRRDGLAVTSLSASHLVLGVSGPAWRFAAALHAPLQRLRLAGGALGYRLGGAARLPASVARFVRGVVGVASVVRERSFARRRPLAPRPSASVAIAGRVAAARVAPRLWPRAARAPRRRARSSGSPARSRRPRRARRTASPRRGDTATTAPGAPSRSRSSRRTRRATSSPTTSASACSR